MTFSKEQVEGIAKKPHCPRCDLNKTIGAALDSSDMRFLPHYVYPRRRSRHPDEPLWEAGADTAVSINSAMTTSRPLGDYLRARRQLIQPEDAGLPGETGRRRVEAE